MFGWKVHLEVSIGLGLVVQASVLLWNCPFTGSDPVPSAAMESSVGPTGIAQALVVLSSL